MADIDAPLAWRMQQDGYLMQINQLRAENAKLRELVTRLLGAVPPEQREALLAGIEVD